MLNGYLFTVISMILDINIRNFNTSYLYGLIPLTLVLIMIVAGFFNSKKEKKIFRWPFKKKKYGPDTDNIEKIIDISGYSYDSKQDIFYSNLDAWQRKMGYCRLYDEAAAPMGMIIDCEPIYFEYAGKDWLIEFWKGQYDLTTGCEVGVYATTGPELNIPGVFNGTFYYSVKDEDLLGISYILRKNKKVLFRRKGRHWWLTGFKVGEFSEPHELTMDIAINFKDRVMVNAFIEGLMYAGYSEREFIIKGNTVILRFDKPHTEQPYTRGEKTDNLIQKKNKELCDKYQYITRKYKKLPDKLNAIQKQSPKIYGKIINIGRIRKLIDIYLKIEKYLG